MREAVSVTIVPAAPGWHALEPVVEERRVVEYARQPIVAWRVELYLIRGPRERGDHYVTTTYPVGVESIGDRAAILSPTGRFIYPETAEFNNEHDALAYATELWQQEHGEPSPDPLDR